MNMMFFGVTLFNDWLGKTKTDPPLLTALTSGVCTAVHWVDLVMKGEEIR